MPADLDNPYLDQARARRVQLFYNKDTAITAEPRGQRHQDDGLARLGMTTT